MSDTSGFDFTMPEDADPLMTDAVPPRISSFTVKAVGGGDQQLPHSVQVPEGATVVLSWAVQGQPTEILIDGADQCPDPSATSITVKPARDVDFVLRAKNDFGEDHRSVHVALHAVEQIVSPHLPVPPRAPAGKIAVEDAAGNVMIDPPLRLLPQYDRRWKDRRCAGPDSSNTASWVHTGCGPSCTAMILRWFAEDCRAGRVPFPELSGTKLAKELYGPRMAQACWPDGFDYYRKGKFAAHPDAPGNPEGKVELDGSGVRNGYLRDWAARRLGKSSASSSPAKAKEDKLKAIRNFLRVGPVILGIQKPAGHYVTAQGYKDGALYIVDPGNVLAQAAMGPKSDKIENWTGKKTLLNGKGMPPASQWPSASIPGNEDNKLGYVAISGQFLDDILSGLSSIHSLSYPGGPAFSGAAAPSAAPASEPAAEGRPAPATAAPKPDGAPLPPEKPAPAAKQEPTPPAKESAGGDLERFFELRGSVGSREKPRDYTYVAYRVPGKTAAWFMKGRYMVDLDGAPRCYHPDPKIKVLPIAQYSTVDVDAWDGALDALRNGGHPGNWFGVVTDTLEATGKPVVQGDDDPAPGYYVTQTSLHRSGMKAIQQRRYADATRIPYVAFQAQIIAETGSRFTRKGQGPTGRLGDLVTAVNLKKKKYAHAIVADTGNQPHFGEGSFALGKKIEFLQGTYEPEVLYITYPHSGAGQGTIPEPAEILAKGNKLFDDFGGMAEVERVLKLMK